MLTLSWVRVEECKRKHLFVVISEHLSRTLLYNSVRHTHAERFLSIIMWFTK